MKATFETEDQQEALRIVKSLDMASFIFELTKNTFRHIEEITVDEVKEKINELIERYGINIDELIE